MDKSMPRNGKEGLIYGAIICALSCLFMATMNICINMGGITKDAIMLSIKVFPLVFVIAMLIEGLIVGKISDKLVKIFSSPTDSINAYILFKAFFTVIGMSIIMTLIGGVLAFGFNIEVLKEFPICWPRNFCVVIFLELIIVQPIARKVMRIIHEKSDNSLELEKDIA